MAVITFDCDEVLADLVKGMLCRHDNRFFGVPLVWDDIVDYYIEHLPQFKEHSISFDQAKQLFDEIIMDHKWVQPVEGMPALVSDLKRQGHELYVITARGDELTDATMTWIQTHYPDMFSDVILANHYNQKNKQCKGDLCHYLGSQIMIEDTMHNTQKVIAKNIPVIMPEKPWNKQYANDHRVYKAQDTDHIKELLIGKGLL
jgi:uncharacterized HAD superfamily protein